MNALVVIETLTPAVFSQEGGIDAMLAKLEADVRAVQTDISTPAGRKAIASLAYKVARSKTALDDMGKDLVADLKAQTGAIDAERKKVRDRLDALRDEVRAPLDEYEAAEERRIVGHQTAIQTIIDLGEFGADMPRSAAVLAALTELEAIPERDWQEFKQKAAAARSETFAKLQALKSAALARETEAAELERLRVEKAEREQKDREDRIAAEAAEGARLAAEAKAAREAKAAADAAAAETARIERERQDAERRAQKAIDDARNAAEKAERDRIAAAEKAEKDRLAAIEAERKRVADAAAAEAAETEKRERNKRHRAKINSDALAALVAAGLSNADGVKVVTAIAKGEIPNVRIQY